MPETLVLVHGLFMGRPAMLPLARRLARHGHPVRCFGYNTVWGSLEANAARLADFLASLEGPVVLVGHSLGGLVSVRVAQRTPPGKVRALALLGSPYQGAKTARVLQRWTGGTLSPVGRSLHDWARLPEHGLPQVPVLTLAGTKARGLGKLLCHLDEPNDGTVTLAETRVPGATIKELPVSHTGIIFSHEVAAEVAAWLATL